MITKIRYSEELVFAYLFRFIEIKLEKNDKEIIGNQELKIKDDYNIMYDLYNLNYIRIKLVYEKEGTINDELKTIHNFQSKLNQINISFISHGSITEDMNKNIKKIKKTKKEESSSEEEEPLKEISKEIINKMQTRSTNEIQEYIFSLAFYGKNISLEKHRPNKERYPTGMSAEPIIKINLMEFKLRVQDKLKKMQKTYQKRTSLLVSNNSESETSNNQISEDENTNDKNDFNTPDIKKEKQKEEEISIDPNIYLNQYVGTKSIKRIQILSIYMFVSIIIILILEFLITLTHINKIVDSLKFGENSFKIINGIAYTKYFITEALFLNDFIDYPHINGTSKIEYIHDLMQELADYQESISGSYNFLTNTSKIKYIKNLTEYMNSLTFNILTISNGEKHTEYLNLASAMGRLSTDIFFVSIIRDNINQITMKNKNTYDLMVNLLNDYYIYWYEITKSIFDSVYSFNQIPTSFYVIFIISFVLTIANCILLENFLKVVIIEKEKPLELVLTIKKKVFDSLKTNSDVFLNNLLNKIVGNDDLEQETKSEASLKIMDNDMYYILIFVVIEIFLIIKFVKVKNSLKIYSKYTKVLNSTEYCQLDLILTCDFVKSFFYDKSIKILNSTDTENIIEEKLEKITDSFGEMILSVYDNLKYLKDNYENFFYSLLNLDVDDILQGTEKSISMISFSQVRGLKSILFRYFEFFRFIWQCYLYNPNANFLYYSKFWNLNNLLRNAIRPWFDTIHSELYSAYFDYHDGQKLFNIYAFIIILVLKEI